MEARWGFVALVHRTNIIITQRKRRLGARVLLLFSADAAPSEAVTSHGGATTSHSHQGRLHGGGEERPTAPEREGWEQEAGPGQAPPAGPSEDEIEFGKQRARFLAELQGDPKRCPHPFRFREWSLENPSQDIGWNTSERRTFRCRICGRIVTERV